MKRRDFITFVSGAAATWPLATRAQQPAMPVVGILNSGSPEGYAPYLSAFREGLSNFGFVEGRTVSIEYRRANGHDDRLPALAADLVRQQVKVIVANAPASLAAKAATNTIPIVFNTGFDPVKFGLVASLNQPGGNATGIVQLGTQLGPKRLELIRAMLPTATQFVALVNPNSFTGEAQKADLQAAAQNLGIELHVVSASSESDFDGAFAAVAKFRPTGLVINGDAYFNDRSTQLATVAYRYAVPAIYQYPEFAAAGGLMSYGTNLVDAFRVAGIYTGRILKSESPADLPVQQSAKFKFVINLQTAKAFGLTVPDKVLAIADEVIE